MLIIGIDVGGTFTDLIIFDSKTGNLQVRKVSSTPDDPVRGLIECLSADRIDLAQAGRFVHGTTIATNAVLERKGAKTALITTKGSRDVIEICGNRRYTGGLFDPKWVRTKPLIPRNLRFEVDERISHKGEALAKLKHEEALALFEKLKELRVESVAVCFINSYVNRSHEERIGEWLERELPGVAYTLSATAVSECGELERFMTALVNAYVAPLLKGYLERLGRVLWDRGYKFQPFYMMSNGGVVTEKTAAAYPIRFILSGPAAAVSAGIYLGERLSVRNIITYDMGGTSTDVCLIKDLKPFMTTRRVFLAFPIRTPQFEINTIGAGGGSIAWVDTTKALRVGPQSAGAVPGPVAYGRGGIEPTVTDANLLLGRIGPTSLLGGTMILHEEAVEKSIESLARKVGVADIYHFAEGIIRIATMNMCGAIREISMLRGYDPRDFTLLAVGGAGPLHAAAIAQELGIRKIIIPNHPGNFAAFGLVAADVRHDYARTYLTELNKADLSRVKGLLKEMADEGRRDLINEGLSGEKIDVSYSADIRYLGQAYELSVPVTIGMEIGDIEREFHREYSQAYGYAREGTDVELVNLRCVATGVVDKPPIPTINNWAKNLAKAMKARRKVYFEGDFVHCPIYQRELLPPDVTIRGPAIIEEYTATTAIYPRWKASVDNLGCLTLEPQGG